MRSSRSCRVLPFDHPAAQAAAMVRAELERRGRPIGPLDNQIAGTALAHRATLVTRNTRESSGCLILPSWIGTAERPAPRKNSGEWGVNRID
jgi:PIN domain